MKRRTVLRLKATIALMLSVTVLIGLVGCDNQGNETHTEPEEKGNVYYKPISAEEVLQENGTDYAASRLLITSVETATYQEIEELAREYDGDIVGYIADTGDYQIQLQKHETFDELQELAEEIKTHACVEEVSPEYVEQIGFASVEYANDPWMESDSVADISGAEWDKTRPSGVNWWAEAIGMPTVWEKDLTLDTVKVGIIDSMFDTTHEDLDEGLFAKLWNNPTDENGNCAVAPLYENSLKDPYAMDENTVSHGTHVAGIIAAQANNGVGITGINQNVELYGYALYSDADEKARTDGYASVFMIKCALAQLFNEGVKVINISWGMEWEYEEIVTDDTPLFPPKGVDFTEVAGKSLESFLLKYIDRGQDFLIVKSAANNSFSKERYKADRDIFGNMQYQRVADRILMVGAVVNETAFDCYRITDNSNTGAGVNVYAPGGWILSTVPTNRTERMMGTSMAAATVSGVASLMWGINPNLSAEQVRSFIMASTGASACEPDEEMGRFKGAINPEKGTAPIIDADVCVQLAQATVDNEEDPDTEYAVLSGIVYCIDEDETLVPAESEKMTLTLHNETGGPIMDVELKEGVVYLQDPQTDQWVPLEVCTYRQMIKPGLYTMEAQVEGHDTWKKSFSVDPCGVYSEHAKLEKTVENTSYIPMLEDLIKQDPYYSNSGFLYDMDHDGVEEMVILGRGEGLHYGYSAYDIEGEKVIAKLENERLFYNAGSPKGTVFVAEYAGELVLVAFADNGETSVHGRRHATHTIYDAKTFEVITTTNRDFRVGSSDEENVYTIDGNTCSAEEYRQITDALQPIITAEAHENDDADGSMTLRELKEYIQQVEEYGE